MKGEVIIIVDQCLCVKYSSIQTQLLRLNKRRLAANGIKQWARSSDKTKGKINQAVGGLSGNKKLKREGHEHKAKSKARSTEESNAETDVQQNKRRKLP